jgi:5-methyltetrahydrofolate--homocysteine methyltransferase
MPNIQEEIKKRILVLDGAMGTMLQRYNFSEDDLRGEQFKDFPHSLKGNNDLLSLTQPTAIKEVHAAYYEAGADIVETNTFSGTTIGMADYHLEEYVYELNYQSAKIAREVADEFTAKNTEKPRFVAGSIGPTNRTASMSPDVNDPGYHAVTFDYLGITYKQQVEALMDGGCDLLLVETIFDTLNAKAALVKRRFQLRSSRRFAEALFTNFSKKTLLSMCRCILMRVYPTPLENTMRHQSKCKRLSKNILKII